MSRRKRRPGEASAHRGQGEVAAGRDHAAEGGPAAPRASGGSIVADLAILSAVVAVTIGVAELAGAANLGVALGIGQVAFAIALVVLLLRA
jgi:hypothetical protein